MEHNILEFASNQNTNGNRFSNQNIINELSEEANVGRTLDTLSRTNGKAEFYELMRPMSWKVPLRNNTQQFVTNTKNQQCTQSGPLTSSASGSLLREQHGQVQNHQQFKSISNCIISLKKEHKTTQTLSIVMGGFIACWLPFFIYYIVTPFLEPNQISRTLTYVLTWLGWLNSAINPFIYAFYSIEFRMAFWRLICRRICSRIGGSRNHINTISRR